MKPHPESGIGLIEVMVAMLLLSVALLGLAAAFAPSRVAIEGGNQVTAAVYLARQTLEAMRNRPYDSDQDEITTAQFPPEGYGTIPGLASFQRSVQIEDDTPVTNTKRVTVSVTYRDNTGQEQTVQLSTIFARST